MGAPSTCYLSMDLNKFVACIHQHSPEPLHCPEMSLPHLSTPASPWSCFFRNLILGSIPCDFSWWCAFKFPLSLSVFCRLVSFFFLTPSNIPSYIPPLCNLFSHLLKGGCSSQVTKWEQLWLKWLWASTCRLWYGCTFSTALDKHQRMQQLDHKGEQVWFCRIPPRVFPSAVCFTSPAMHGRPVFNRYASIWWYHVWGLAIPTGSHWQLMVILFTFPPGHMMGVSKNIF